MRLDLLLVERGLLPNRSKARDAILQGSVIVGGVLATKPGQPVSADARIKLAAEPCPYVSRAGLKLAHALEHFDVDPKDLAALDIGASTGGFTDVLLRHGAAHVTTVDVGHGQLHESLRNDPRVTVCERLNARDLTAEHLATPPGLVVCDASFISLKLVLPPALALAAPDARLIALIKPQFEVGRAHIGKGGIVRDASQHEATCDDIRSWLEDAMHWDVLGVTPSPIEGSDGNREFLIAARRRTSAS